MWAAIGAAAVVVTGVIVVAAGSDGSSGWRELAQPPLSPREYPTGFWTGEEVILVGGSDAPPCPPNAECEAPSEPPLADGAAYDPEADTWRAIADAPVRFSWAQPLVVGSTAYLWIAGEPWRPQAPSAFLAYRIREDRWEELDMPTHPASYQLVAAGDRIVAVSGSDEEEERRDLVYDPSSSEWSELPPDPFSPGFDRVAVWDGEELLLFDHELTEDLSGDLPLRAAAFDFESGAWHELENPDLAWAQARPQPGFSSGPPMPEEAEGGTTEVEAGDDRFVFLGSSEAEDQGWSEGKLVSRAWLWSPRP